MARVLGCLTLVSVAITIASSASSTSSTSTPPVVMRPNLYFGTRTTSPHPVQTGLMWYGLGQPGAGSASSAASAASAAAAAPLEEGQVRHTAEMGDGMDGWGWTAHDGRSFGRQHIGDVANGMDLTTEWVAARPGDDDGLGGKHWALRVRGDARKGERTGRSATLVFYVSVGADVTATGTTAGTGGGAGGADGEEEGGGGGGLTGWLSSLIGIGGSGGEGEEREGGAKAGANANAEIRYYSSDHGGGVGGAGGAGGEPEPSWTSRATATRSSVAGGEGSKGAVRVDAVGCADYPDGFSLVVTAPGGGETGERARGWAGL